MRNNCCGVCFSQYPVVHPETKAKFQQEIPAENVKLRFFAGIYCGCPVRLRQAKKRETRREIFLERMSKLIPWKQLEKKVACHYPKGQNGRPPYPLSAML